MANADTAKVASFCRVLRASDRVKPSVKEIADDELLAHYDLARGDVLTKLGVLLVGGRHDRARLGTASIVQAIKYDEREVKVAKWSWDDNELSPIELVDAIWEGIPDFRESYEIPEGMFRKHSPRTRRTSSAEVLVNALVHRPYTQSGDIYLNLHPDRLKVVNPGRLPLGVTPHNILHASRRRNHGLARIFHDLGLMEREGSGFDLLYDHLLTTGRAAPTVKEGTDSTHVTIERRVLHPGVVRLIADADERHQLSQRERIALGLLGQAESMSAAELADGLDASEAAELRPSLGRLVELSLVEQSGRTNATCYFVPSALLR
jgi:ATP-dependent DNA helicase RecG